MFTVYSLALNTQLATYAQKYENSTMLTHSLDHIHHALSIFLTSPHPIKLALYTLCFTISVMPIISSAILSLHYATNHENLWLYHIGVAQTQIQPSPLTHKAPSRLQSYSHLLHILAHQCLPFLTLVSPIHLVMQILLSSLSLNVFLLFSHTHFIPSAHHHTSWCRKFSSCTPSLHRAMAKNIIFLFTDYTT